MTNEQQKARYFKISPRGFANQVVYVRITNDDQAAAIEKRFANYEDNTERGGFAEWTNDSAAQIPGVAVAFDDLNRVFVESAEV